MYAYDAKGQLTHSKFLTTGNPSTAVATVNPTHQFDFDAAGNRRSASTPSQGTVNYTADNTNQYTLVTGDQPTYDDNGNLTSLRGRSLTWDRRDRLRSNGNISYIYDALGRMVQRKNTTTGATRRFTWSGWLMISERKKDSAGNETAFLRYTWGADLSGSLEGAGAVGGLLMIERFAAGSGTAQTAYAHPDANGNTMGLTSDTGALLAWYQYHPFGQIEAQGGNANWLNWNSFTFSTKWQDADTALHYYGYRYYDPTVGRFINRDPIEERGGVNLYGFVNNDGVNHWDYLGMAAKYYVTAEIFLHDAGYSNPYTKENVEWREWSGGTAAENDKLEIAYDQVISTVGLFQNQLTKWIKREQAKYGGLYGPSAGSYETKLLCYCQDDEGEDEEVPCPEGKGTYRPVVKEAKRLYNDAIRDYYQLFLETGGKERIY